MEVLMKRHKVLNIFITLLFLCIVTSKIAAAGNFSNDENSDILNNPEGYYLVSRQGVYRINVIERDERGDYKYRSYMVAFANPKFHRGQLASAGWWYPSYQQSNNVSYMEFVGRKKCNGFWPETRSWSGTYVKNHKVLVGNGRAIEAYETTNNYPPKRAPLSKQCAAVTVSGDSCKLHCDRWINTKEVKLYLVKEIDDALDLYSYMRRLL